MHQDMKRTILHQILCLTTCKNRLIQHIELQKQTHKDILKTQMMGGWKYRIETVSNRCHLNIKPGLARSLSICKCISKGHQNQLGLDLALELDLASNKRSNKGFDEDIRFIEIEVCILIGALLNRPCKRILILIINLTSLNRLQSR